MTPHSLGPTVLGSPLYLASFTLNLTLIPLGIWLWVSLVASVRDKAGPFLGGSGSAGGGQAELLGGSEVQDMTGLTGKGLFVEGTGKDTMSWTLRYV